MVAVLVPVVVARAVELWLLALVVAAVMVVVMELLL